MIKLGGRPLLSLIFCPPDNATSYACARVARWLRLQIVRFRVHDNGPANHRLLVVRQRDLMVHIIQFRLAGSVCLHVSHVAYMPFQRVRPRMWFVGWIKMSAGGTRIRRAAIAKFMNVKTMIARRESCYLCLNLHAIGNFGERNGTTHLAAGCGMKHRDGL